MHFLAIPYPAIDPVAFSLGPISIKWYGLAYVAGLLLGWWYVKRLLAEPKLWPEEKPPFRADLVDDLFIWVALGVIIGGRVGHVLLYEPGQYLSDPLQILMVHKGGMAFHGGALGTIAAMWLFARRRGMVPLTVMDLVAAAVPFGLFFGRIANFINGEVVGAATTVPWAMVIPGWGPEPRHPSQLYEALLEGAALFVILRWLTHKSGALAKPGVVGGAFVGGYGAFRMFCELFKHDEYQVFGALPITTGMIYSIPMVLAGLLLVLNGHRSRPT
jgi:phosphatidylglycerol---prolipoprotein diacylglyceryl transferase